MSQTVNPAELPPEARITLTQQAATNDGSLTLNISGTGWVPPSFDAIDWSQPVTVVPVGPTPGSPANITGKFNFSVNTNLATQQLDWSINSVEAIAGEEEAPEEAQTEITVSLLDQGWAILRSANGTAIPMVAYSKKKVSASGTGTPPVTASPLTQINFLGIDILVTEYNNNTQAKTWSIAGEEQ